MSLSPRWRRLLPWLVGLPLVLVLLVLVLGSIAITTETGLNTLLGAANRFAPGELSYKKVSGRITGPLHVEGLEYKNGPLKVTVDKADLDWNPADLLRRHLNISSLRFEGLDIHLPPADKAATDEPFVLPDIQLPLQLTVTELQGRAIRIIPAVGEPIQIDSIDLKARSGLKGLLIDQLAVRSPLGQLQANGFINPTGKYPLQLDLAWEAPVPNYGLLKGQGKVEGNLRERVTLTHTVTGPATLELTGEVRQPLTEATWSAKTRIAIPDLKPFVPSLAGNPLTADIDAQGVMARFQGKGELTTVLPQLGPTTVRFTAAGDPTAIKLNELRVTAPDRALTLITQGEVQWANGVLSHFQSQGDLKATMPELGPTALRFTAAGNTQSIKLNELRVVAPDWALNLLTTSELRFSNGALSGFQTQGDLKATLPELGPTTLRFTAAGDTQTIKLNELRVAAPDWALTMLTTGELQFANGTLSRLQSQGDLKANIPQFGPATLRFTADGDANVIKLNDLRLSAANRPLSVSAKGQVQLADLRFNATGQWQSLVWPLRGVAQVESSKGDFTVEGTPKAYRFSATAADLRGPTIPKGSWTISGQGSDQAVRDVKLVGKVLEGTLEAAADATWAPTVGWRAAVRGQGLNPGAHWKEVPGKLNVRLKTDGSFEKNALRANLLLEELTGTLSGQVVSGKGDVSLQGQNLTIRALDISAGAARLEANGTLTERWDLAWKLNAPQLKSLLPGLSGSVASTGKLSGSRTQPVVAANFTIRELRQGTTSIRQLQGEANLDTGDQSRSRLVVTGDGMVLGGQNWKTLRIDGSGTSTAHELKADLVGDPGQFLLALSGGLQTPALVWQGRITQLEAKNTVAGTWRLEKPAGLRASAKEASLETACLSSTPTRLCLQGQWNQSGAFNGRAQLVNLSPEQFKRFFPQGTTLTTTVNGEATASGTIGGALQGKVDLNIAPGNVTMLVDGRPIQLGFNASTVRLNSDGRTATGQLRLDLAQMGQLQANVTVQDPLGAARLNGKVDATITDLKIIMAFVPQITEVSGQIRANVGLTGTVFKPALRGEIRLDNAALTIPEVGLKLQDIQLVAASAGRELMQLSGSVRSDPGRLQLSGQLNPFKPQLKLTIVGENFQAVKTADIQVQISPDLKIDVTPQQTRVEGTVTVPRASIRPGGNQPGAVNPSADVVIVKTREGEVPKAKGEGMGIFADVRIVLGKDVYLETPAFKGQLRGDVQVVETPQLAPRGTGSFEVVAGKYKIYGEEIEIQRGQLLFSSSPLDNPSLDLRVVRQERNIISGSEIMAGAQVRGTVKTPKLTFFSSPNMSDPDILAYLVLGRAPGGTGNEAAMLFKAASALGSGKGGGLTKSLSDAFGLDSAGLGSTSDGGTSFMIGKYLTPRLYVDYGIGLINAVNTFFLKYQFTKHLMLESATNSLGTGGDFIYTIER